MTKLSSRLQSRLARRRGALRELDTRRQLGKALTTTGDALLKHGLISQMEFNEHLGHYRKVRHMAREMSINQQLDKALIGIIYKLENGGRAGNNTFILGGNMVVVEPLSRP